MFPEYKKEDGSPYSDDGGVMEPLVFHLFI